MVTIKVFVPTYFNKFFCIADKCPDSCCIGWEVDIDGETADKYSTVDGELGDKIKKHLVSDDDGYMFTLCEGDRCPFLNDCNLCEIQKSRGESFLSRTCTLFPRFFDDFGSFREMGLGFACPEAARIMLSESEDFSLICQDTPDDENTEVDEEFLRSLLDLRADILSVLNEKDVSFRDKIQSVLTKAKYFQQKTDGESFFDGDFNRSFDDCLSVLLEMEYISDKRRSFIEQIKIKKPSEVIVEKYKDDFEKLMKYYIFRYLLKAVYDYDVLTKVKYSVFACIVTAGIYTHFGTPDFETRVKIMYGYSKEVEYSDMNMELLDEVMYGGFSSDDLLAIL